MFTFTWPEKKKPTRWGKSKYTHSHNNNVASWKKLSEKEHSFVLPRSFVGSLKGTHINTNCVYRSHKLFVNPFFFPCAIIWYPFILSKRKHTLTHTWSVSYCNHASACQFTCRKNVKWAKRIKFILYSLIRRKWFFVAFLTIPYMCSGVNCMCGYASTSTLYRLYEYH